MHEIPIYDLNNKNINTLVQWDKDVFVLMKNLPINSAFDVHFYNSKSENAYVVNSTYENEILKAKIPNILLQTAIPIIGYVYVEDNSGNRSSYFFKIIVSKRPRPSDYVHVDSLDYVNIQTVAEEISKYRANVWIKYCNQEPNSEYHVLKDETDDWMGVYNGEEMSAPEDWRLYNWYLIKGAKGDTPIIGDNKNWFISGVDTGLPSNGKTPYIGENGNWFIGEEDTGVVATAKDGITPHIGDDKYWYIGEENTGIVATAKDGETPYIGENGNWFVGNDDTGVFAGGANGDTPYIGNNGNWHIGDEDTGVTAYGFSPELSIGNVKNVSNGELPKVTITGTTSNPILNFELPIGETGLSGATFTPLVDSNGDLSWSNEHGLKNPDTVNIKGKNGDSGIYFGQNQPEASNHPIWIYEDEVPDIPVLSVLNNLPDENGNVSLSASDVGALPTSGGAMTGQLDMNGQVLTGLNDPVSGTDATRKGYVDNKIGEIPEGQSVKDYVDGQTIETDPTLSIEGAAADAKAVGDALGAFVRPNLLDSWYFKNPVNQRGVSGVISDTGYFIDRWKLVSGTVETTDNGLILNGTIEQILEFAIGQTTKASVLTSTGVLDGVYDDSTKTFTITATGATIVAAKLELGNTQTLAHEENGVWVLNEIPDFGEQLAKCQRDFVRYDDYIVTCGYISAGAKSYALTIPLPVPMRTTPVIRNAPAMIVRLPTGGYSSAFPSGGALPSSVSIYKYSQNSLSIIYGVDTEKDTNNILISAVIQAGLEISAEP